MMKNNAIIAAAIAATLSLSVTVPMTTHAAGKEKCYGVAEAKALLSNSPSAF